MRRNVPKNLRWEISMVPLLQTTARLAQSVERKALNLVVVGSSPTVGAFLEGPRIVRALFPQKSGRSQPRCALGIARAFPTCLNDLVAFHCLRSVKKI